MRVSDRFCMVRVSGERRVPALHTTKPQLRVSQALVSTAALGAGCGVTHTRQDTLCGPCRTDANLFPTFPRAETAMAYPGLGEEYSGGWSVQGRCTCPSALEGLRPGSTLQEKASEGAATLPIYIARHAHIGRDISHTKELAMALTLEDQGAHGVTPVLNQEPSRGILRCSP